MLFPSAPSAEVERLRGLLTRRGRMVIIAHYNPDGDAMGSSLGLVHVLRRAGFDAQVVMPNTPPVDLHWMPGFAEVLCADRHKEASLAAIASCDLLFCLDFNRPDRVGVLEDALRAAPVKVLIDHHRDPDTFAQATFSDTTACATAQMVFDIVSALGLSEHIDVDAATCLYTGLMTDSGSFRFPSTTPHTLHVAAELLARGARPDRIHEAIMDNSTGDRLRLLGFSLHERMELLPELRTALFVLSKADMDRFNFQPGDTEGLVNYGLSIRGYRLSAFIAERPDVVKLSLRSKGRLPVNEFLAAHFGGGGHANAAGGNSTAALSEVVATFKRELPAFLCLYPA